MKKVYLLIVLISQLLILKAQEDPIILTVNDQKIPKSEFIRIYKKNIETIQNSEDKSVKEYLELFVNFKLKVIEAESFGMDTLDAFKAELNKYRKQLAKSYLTDKDEDEKLLKEAYERLNYDLNASHILIRLDPSASPRDTMTAYNKAIKIRQRLIDGESFDVVAKGTSDDPSVKRNEGNLGYFTTFQMVYPFESAAYRLEVNQISEPVKTRFGYHVIKLNDKRKAVGKIKVAHIMKLVPQISQEEKRKEAKEEINKIYHRIKNGEDFALIAKEYSEDPGSAKNGGEIPWFGAGRMVPEFEKAAFDLEFDGAISEPVETSFGWHIIKRLEREEIASFKEMKHDLKTRIARDQRSLISQEKFVNKLKTEYGFEEDTNSLSDFYELIPDSIFHSRWTYDERQLNKVLFKVGDKAYFQKDFAGYITNNIERSRPQPIKGFVNGKYKDFVNDVVLDVEDQNLEDKYEPFKNLVKEYRDGILLFELTDEIVWSKAVSDSVELKKYYNNNSKKYLQDNLINATIYDCGNESIALKLRKFLKKNKTKRLSDQDIYKGLGVEEDKSLVKISQGEFKEGENAIVDGIKKKKGLSELVANGDHMVLINIHDLQINEALPFNKARAMVVIDYQNFLEQEWIKQLRAKYEVVVDESVLSTVN